MNAPTIDECINVAKWYSGHAEQEKERRCHDEILRILRAVKERRAGLGIEYMGRDCDGCER